MATRPAIDVTYADAPRIVIWETIRSGVPAADMLTTAEAKAFIADVARCGGPLLVLAGSDPLARPDLFELVAYAGALGLRVIVSTRAGMHLTIRALARLYESGCRRIAVAVDAADADLSTARAARGLGFELHVDTVASRRNAGFLREIAALIAPLGATLWNLHFLIPGAGVAAQDCLDAGETEQAFATLFDLWLTAPFDLKAWEAPHYHRYVAERLAAMAPGERPAKAASALLGIPTVGEGKGFVFVSYRGEIMPSGLLPLVMGNVRTHRLLDIYRSHPTMQRLRDPSSFSGACGRCEERDLCGGSRARAYALTGDPFAQDPFCRRLAGAAGERT